MATARKTPVTAFRKRLRQKGMVREEDASLVRSVAKALGDPQMAAEARSLLAESERLMKEAAQLSGAPAQPAPKPTRGRKKQAVADAAH